MTGVQADLVRVAAKNDPSLATLIWVPSPENRSIFLPLVVSPLTVRALRDGKRNVAIGEYCGLVHGQLAEPPTAGLASAVALFRGIKRPMKASASGSEILAYVLNPLYSYEFHENHRFAGVGAKPAPAPDRSVFVVYAEQKTASPSALMGIPDDIRAEVVGTINYWEWVCADPTDPSLPENYGSRYLEKVW